MYRKNTKFEPKNRKWFRKQKSHMCGARRSSGTVQYGKPQINTRETYDTILDYEFVQIFEAFLSNR